MFFALSQKQGKIPVAYRIALNKKNELTLMVLATNWVLEYLGIDNTINETKVVELSIGSMYSGNQHVVCVGNKVYTMKEILRKYIDLACIKYIDEFLYGEKNIKIKLDELFREQLEYGIEALDGEDEIEIDKSELQNQLNNGELHKVFQEINYINEDVKSEIIGEFESKVFEYLKFNKYVLEYTKFESYKFEEVKYNKERLEKLIDLYLYNQEYKGVVLGNGKIVYREEFEKFITSGCKDMNITGYSNGR